MTLKTYTQFLLESAHTGALVNEAKKKSKIPRDEERTALVLDGTSSAGKSYTAKNSGVKSKGRWKTDEKGDFMKDDKGNFIKAEYSDDEFQTIALDDYWGNEPLDKKDAPENQARWELEKNDPFYTDEEKEFSKKYGDTFAHIGKDYKKLVTDWNASSKKKLKSGKDDKGNELSKDDIKALKNEIKGYDDRLKDWPTPARNHPDWDSAKKKAKEKGNEFRDWEPQRFFMMQEYKQSKNKNVMFDDITGDVSQFLPDGSTKTVLLHAPMDKLIDNIGRREKDDPRDPKDVFDDYASKYQFTKEKPTEATGQPGKPLKKKDVIAMLEKCRGKSNFSQSTIDDEWIKNYAKSMGLDDDTATYYMKVKDEYIKQNEPVIVNADDDNQKTFDAFKKVVDAEKNRVQEGKKEVGEKAFADRASGKEVKKEDVGLTKIFLGFGEKMTQRLQHEKVPVKIPGKKAKLVQRQTLLDFVPVDRNDPREMTMVLSQKQQYLLIQAARKKAKLKPLANYEVWIEKKFALAQDNVEYQRRKKAALLRAANKGKSVKERYVPNFTQFLSSINA